MRLDKTNQKKEKRPLKGKRIRTHLFTHSGIPHMHLTGSYGIHIENLVLIQAGSVYTPSVSESQRS